MKPEFGNIEQIATLRTESELSKNGFIEGTGIRVKRHTIREGFIYFEWLEVSMGRYCSNGQFYELDDEEPCYRFDLIVRGYDFTHTKTKDPIYPYRVPLENIIKNEL